MNLRQPVSAGSFYEATPTSCRHHATKLTESAQLPDDLPETLYGGIVPHAGWLYSGHLAALTIKAILANQQINTLVLLGADHCGAASKGEVFDSGVWRTPLGDIAINQDLAAALVAAGDYMRANPPAHASEHSLEVQVPLIQLLNPAVQIVPISVPPTNLALKIGQVIGRVLSKSFPNASLLASSDMTHHAGHFPAPGGRGPEGVEWTERNDRRMLELVRQLDAPNIITEAYKQGNACGAGAIAAATSAARIMGATTGLILDYTNSYRIIHERLPDEQDDTTVGYASVVFA